MTTASLQDIKNLSDSLRQQNFELVIPNIPNGGDSDILRLRCANSSLPGFSSEMTERALHGHVVKEAGRGVFPRTIAAEFVEGAEMPILTMMKDWHRLQWDPATGVQAPSAIYKVTGYLDVYNAAKEKVKRLVLSGLCIEDVADTAMSGEGSEAVRVSVTFSYDDWDFQA